MTESVLDTVRENWDKYVGLIKKISDENTKTNLLTLVGRKDVNERLMVAPASTRTEFVGAYPGGLVESSLQTAKLMNKLNKAYEANLSLDSIILCGLFSSIGKIGTETDDLYIPNDSDWHRNRGMMYEYDREVGKTPFAVRSLWWLNNAGVGLTEDEIHAISSLATYGKVDSDGQALFNVPMLVVVLQNAYRVVCQNSTGKTSVID